MSNRLSGETSPYLLQHAENPVDWYPWCPEAFQRAREEDRPIFLSIGYSTCHWCHVMERESFEDVEIAGILNRYFICIKVDKEERPDIDSIYMAVCQAFTGSGGWPTSIFMTADKRPFFAGTYFPRTARRGMAGFRELLLAIHSRWENGRESLLRSADELTAALRQTGPARSPFGPDGSLADRALSWYRENFDARFGGFGPAPKFPAAHNLLFLLQQYEKRGEPDLLKMAEVTLRQMYAGGLFDHVGYGFCRYSTDRFYLVPHFEKMLCDNALLILAYCRAHELTGKALYLDIAEKTAGYILAEMASPGGGFCSAQDADSGGSEGKFYVFTPGEIINLLGEEAGRAFCGRFGITEAGNFEGGSIPNLLHARSLEDPSADALLPAVREYRRRRSELRTDDKILTSWNSLMIAALCSLFRRSGCSRYLEAAKNAQAFIEDHLCVNDTLYVSFRAGRRGAEGFLDEYACYVFALLALYDATLDGRFLERAARLAETAAGRYYDPGRGGFYLYGAGQEELLFRPKECYDGALPSGNSLMACNLLRLSALIPGGKMESVLERQLAYMSGEAERHPAGFAMFLTALSDFLEPPATITVVHDGCGLDRLPASLPSCAIVRVLDEESDGYRLINGETTFYVCQGNRCLPPVNRGQLESALRRGGSPPQ